VRIMQAVSLILSSLNFEKRANIRDATSPFQGIFFQLGLFLSATAQRFDSTMLTSLILPIPPAAMVVFSILLAEFSWRFFKDRPLVHRGFIVTGSSRDSTFNSFDERQRGKTMIWAVVASNTLIFVRSVYRG